MLLLDDCFTNFNYPEVGKAAVELLEASGFEVRLADHRCCGRPMMSHGLLEDTREVAAHNVREFDQLAGGDTQIVGCEPSCLLTLREEYPELVPGKAAQRVAAKAVMLEEFLQQLSDRDELDIDWQPLEREVLYHGHCHQKAHIGTQATLRTLQLVPGQRVEEVNSGCCGMAGSFGFEKGHYEIPAVNSAAADTEIAVSGVSCRQQIDHFTNRTARHVAEILRDSLKDSR